MRGGDVLDPALLTTFLAVADTRSFTRAAARLGISQPTVSQHIRKLELATGRTLVARDTREVALTDNGDALAGFARTILAAHAAADGYFSGSAMRGRLRFGAADDLAQTQLPRILRHFRRLYPQINLELTVSQSWPLYRRLKSGHLDLILVKQVQGDDSGLPEYGTVVQRDELVWVGEEATALEGGAPVPLVTYHAPSISRRLAIRALEGVGRTWRVTCNTREVNGVLAAVRAGLGIAALPSRLLPPDLVQVGPRLGLPFIGDVEFTLLENPIAPADPVRALATAIRERTLT
jgi:DNA-binding transcriptional LysR family regulator